MYSSFWKIYLLAFLLRVSSLYAKLTISSLQLYFPNYAINVKGRLTYMVQYNTVGYNMTGYNSIRYKVNLNCSLLFAAEVVMMPVVIVELLDVGEDLIL